jgi:hypothetical protein
VIKNNYVFLRKNKGEINDLKSLQIYHVTKSEIKKINELKRYEFQPNKQNKSRNIKF